MQRTIQSINFNTSCLGSFSDKSNPLFNLQNSVIDAEGFLISGFYGVNTFYTIDNRNNLVSFIESTSTEIIRTFVVPTGNYTLNTMMSSLNNLFSTTGTNTYTVTVNTLTNKLTITSTAVTFKLVNTGNQHCYYELGFDSLNPNFAETQTGSSTYDLSGVKCININTHSLGYGSNLVVNKNLNIICSIPITVGYLGVISFNPASNFFISAQIPDVSTIQFSLYDERFRALTIDKDWQLTMLFNV